MTTYDKKSESFVGFLDYGTAIPEPELNEATEHLVFMIVGITDQHKHFITYMLHDRCSASFQSPLIKRLL